MRAPINLCFRGGGIKSTAYIGALKALDEKEILKNTKNYCGTSSGAIMAMLLALEYSQEEIRDIVYNKSYSDFKDNEWLIPAIINIKRKGGWYNCKNLEKWLKQLIKAKLGSVNAKFKELDKGLKVITFNETKQETVIFSNETHPDLEIWKAVRASISIPLYFEWIVLFGDRFVDGGIEKNYGIDVFDDKYEKDETLGFFLQGEVKKNHNKKGVIQRIKNYITFWHEKACEAHIEPSDAKRTVVIDTGDYSAVDFDIKNKDKDILIKSGYNATKIFLLENR
jgi:NTE family protein